MKNKPLITAICFVLVLSGFFREMFSQPLPSTMIQVKNVPGVRAMTIKATLPTSALSINMAGMYSLLNGYLNRRGVKPVGAPFSVYYAYDPNGSTVVEAGIPVQDQVQDSAQIKYKKYPDMKAISTIYTGPYDKMHITYASLLKYAQDNHLLTRSDIWEVYLTDPSKTRPEKFQTLIYLPLKE